MCVLVLASRSCGARLRLCKLKLERSRRDAHLRGEGIPHESKVGTACVRALWSEGVMHRRATPLSAWHSLSGHIVSAPVRVSSILFGELFTMFLVLHACGHRYIMAILEPHLLGATFNHVRCCFFGVAGSQQ